MAQQEQRVVVVTGAFGALGRQVVRSLSDDGWRVALVDAAPAAPADLAVAAPPAAVHAGIDLGDAQAARVCAQAIAAAFGRIDALVNIAGGFRWQTIEAGDPGAWDQMFAMNVKTALHMSRAALPWLLASPAGAIVNVGAAAAARAGAGMGAYAAAKSGVLRLTEALAEEGKDRGLRVNAVLPGIIDTPANRREMPQADTSRWVTPDAVADVVGFLLSPASRAITGAGIPVTGRL
ncbi:SDR family NAD(P)-dependent oxidoreductase [Caldimonas sp. KR1-144]|uniref:SDR family NAD(P)-dependent oxidoreductase n=1 Tax=Caldimonas sp. KR1-144 TaxID=3400911 RepID=UPI003C06F11B